MKLERSIDSLAKKLDRLDPEFSSNNRTGLNCWKDKPIIPLEEWIKSRDTPYALHYFPDDFDRISHLVDYMIQLLESGDPVKDISDLINQTFMFRHTDLSLVNKYNELWEKTLDELEPKVKELVMFRIKLFYERKMKEKAYDLAQFELARFAAKEKFDKIVLECRCLSCPCITYEMIDLIEYTIRLRYHIEGLPALEKDCPSCNNIGSLQIIDL